MAAARSTRRHDPRVEEPGAAERAGREEQRVARQDRRDDQAGLGKDDEEDDAVDPGAVRLGQREKVLVDLQDEIYRRMHQDIVSQAPRRRRRRGILARSATRTDAHCVTRPVPESLARCELTHLSRVPIDVAVASAQHQQYEEALRVLGCTVRHVPAAHELPDSVFVEDVAIVLDEIAIITRPGAASRRPEREAVAAVLSEYRPLQAIAAPGTLDGGDVLRLGRTLYVGLSTRTNEDGARQLAGHVAPFGYAVECVQTAGCLHLKSAATAVDSDRVLCNPAWIDTRVFRHVDVIPVDPRSRTPPTCCGSVTRSSAPPATSAPPPT